MEALHTCGESCFHLPTFSGEARLVVGTTCSLKKQMARKKLFPQFHLLATEALKLWLWTGAPTTKWSNRFTSEIKVQMRVIPKTNKWFLGHTSTRDWLRGPFKLRGILHNAKENFTQLYPKLISLSGHEWGTVVSSFWRLIMMGLLESDGCCAVVKWTSPCIASPSSCYDQMTQAHFLGWLELIPSPSPLGSLPKDTVASDPRVPSHRAIDTGMSQHY